MKSESHLIKLVLFDIGGVLIDSGKYINKPATEGLCDKLNKELSLFLKNKSSERQHLTMSSIEQCIDDARSHYKSVRTERQPMISAYVKNLLLEQMNFVPSKQELHMILNLFAEIEIRPFKPEAKLFIQNIHKSGIPWGIVANTMWPSNAWRSKIRAEFTQCPPSVAVWSTDMGYRKPNPLMIIHACKSVGVPEANTIYIGNKDVTDMAACSRAGVQGVLLTDKVKLLSHLMPVDNPNPYLIVTSLQDLEQQWMYSPQ